LDPAFVAGHEIVLGIAAGKGVREAIVPCIKIFALVSVAGEERAFDVAGIEMLWVGDNKSGQASADDDGRK
jgi:hypothetical protein